MVTLDILTDQIKAEVSGALVTDESKFTDELVQKLIHQSRAELIASMKVRNYPDILYQRYYPTYDSALQISDCYVEFVIPDPINMGARGDGIRYLGNRNEFQPFTRMGTGAMKSVYAQHRLTNPKNRKETMWAASMDETGYMKVQLYNNVEIEEIEVWGMFADPTEVTYFRQDTDPYPISAEMIPVLKEMVFEKMVFMAQTPADVLSNSQDTPSGGAIETRAPKRRRR